MKIVRITLEYTPTVFADMEYRRLRLTVSTKYMEYIADKMVKDSNITSVFDISMKLLTDEMRSILIKAKD